MITPVVTVARERAGAARQKSEKPLPARGVDAEIYAMRPTAPSRPPMIGGRRFYACEGGKTADVGGRGSREESRGRRLLMRSGGGSGRPARVATDGGLLEQPCASEKRFPVGSDPLRLSPVENGNTPIPRPRCYFFRPTPR